MHLWLHSGSVGSTTYIEIEDEDIEDEFRKLELEVGGSPSPVPTLDMGSGKETISSEAAELLSKSIASLSITDDVSKKTVVQDSTQTVRNNRNPEAA